MYLANFTHHYIILAFNMTAGQAPLVIYISLVMNREGKKCDAVLP